VLDLHVASLDLSSPMSSPIAPILSPSTGVPYEVNDVRRRAMCKQGPTRLVICFGLGRTLPLTSRRVRYNKLHAFFVF